MVNYKKMYALMCGAVSDSLDLLSGDINMDSINSARSLLQQAMIRAEHIYIATAEEDRGSEGGHG